MIELLVLLICCGLFYELFMLSFTKLVISTLNRGETLLFDDYFDVMSRDLSA